MFLGRANAVPRRLALSEAHGPLSPESEKANQLFSRGVDSLYTDRDELAELEKLAITLTPNHDHILIRMERSLARQSNNDFGMLLLDVDDDDRTLSEEFDSFELTLNFELSSLSINLSAGFLQRLGSRLRQRLVECIKRREADVKEDAIQLKLKLDDIRIAESELKTWSEHLQDKTLKYDEISEEVSKISSRLATLDNCLKILKNKEIELKAAVDRLRANKSKTDGLFAKLSSLFGITTEANISQKDPELTSLEARIRRVSYSIMIIESDITKDNALLRTQEEGLASCSRSIDLWREKCAAAETKFCELVRTCDKARQAFDESLALTSIYTLRSSLENYDRLQSKISVSDDSLRRLVGLECNQFEQTPKQQLLPVYAHKYSILDALDKSRVILLVSSTGSGKSTQVPQYLLDHLSDTVEQNRLPRVCVTQPRRLAAKRVAARVAKERAVRLGDEVGYRVGREQPVAGANTRLQFVTMGILLNEMMRNPKMPTWDLVVVDEAHHRDLQADMGLALLKKAMELNSRLRLVIMSAEFDSTRVAEYFGDCPVIKVEGRHAEVFVKYSNRELSLDPETYISRAVNKCLEIHQSEDDQGPPSTNRDILVFLPGVNDLTEARTQLQKKCEEQDITDLESHHLFSGSSDEEVIKATGDSSEKDVRRVIFATNVAETSVTFNSLGYVVDTGVEKISSFDASLRIHRLLLSPISYASMIQRRGRVGRTCDGYCYCLYREDDAEQFARFRSSEHNLELAILQLCHLGYRDPYCFDWLDRPTHEAIHECVRILRYLDMIEDMGTDLKLTKIGKLAVELQRCPKEVKALVRAHQLGCSEEYAQCLTLRSMREDGDFFENELSSYINAVEAGASSTYLALYRGWVQAVAQRTESAWCSKHGVRRARMLEAENELNEMLRRLRRSYRPVVGLAGSSTITRLDEGERLSRANLSGFFVHLAKANNPKGGVRAGFCILRGGRQARVHLREPILMTSTNDLKVDWVIFGSALKTSHINLRAVDRVQHRWIDEEVPRPYLEEFDWAADMQLSYGKMFVGLGRGVMDVVTNKLRVAYRDSEETCIATEWRSGRIAVYAVSEELGAEAVLRADEIIESTVQRLSAEVFTHQFKDGMTVAVRSGGEVLGWSGPEDQEKTQKMAMYLCKCSSP